MTQPACNMFLGHPSSPTETAIRPKGICNGNNIFRDDYHLDNAPSNEVSRSNESEQRQHLDEPAAYEQLKNYHRRTRSRHCSSPELTRRYFSDLEEVTPQSALSEEFSFTGHLAQRTSQLDRMDMNTVTGKNSLFICNREEEVKGSLYGKTILTESGSKLLLPFSKESFLGEGRYSKVYRGSIYNSESTSWHEVAVKLAYKDPDSIEALTHEVDVLKKLVGPNIIHLIDSVKLKRNDAFELGYVMELAAFGTLESFLVAKEVFSLSLSQFISWSRQLLLAVKALRDASITHFDIKPQNILVMSDYTIRLADFGEALLESGPKYSETLGRGTLHYTAPELLSLGKTGSCDGPAVDMYSAGLVMYSLMTGRLPWRDIKGPATHQILICKKGFAAGGYNPLPTAETTEEFKLPGPNGEVLSPSVARRLSKLISGCTALDPANRLSFMDALSQLDDVPL